MFEFIISKFQRDCAKGRKICLIAGLKMRPRFPLSQTTHLLIKGMKHYHIQDSKLPHQTSAQLPERIFLIAHETGGKLDPVRNEFLPEKTPE